MKILQLCKKFPYPLKDGESIAIHQVGKSLVKMGVDVSLLAMNTSKHYFKFTEIPEELSFYSEINTVFVDNKIKLIDACLNMFSGRSYHIQRFISNDFSDQLLSLLRSNDYDIIQLETIYLAPYIDIIKKNSKAKIVLRSHNLEFEIWERIAENTKSIFRKKYLQIQSLRLKQFELAQLHKYDYILTISKRDEDNMKRLGALNKISTVSVGLDVSSDESSQSTSKRFSFGFIGSLDWMPNHEGITWLLGKVVPQINKNFENVTFNIAGRNTPSSLLQYGDERVNILGEVDDATEFIRSQEVMLVPLFSGSGMRIKILEAMSLSKVVITTSIGLEGIEAKDGVEVLIAENESQFIEKIKFALEHPEELERIGIAAKKLIEKEFNCGDIGNKLIGIYEKLLVSSENNVILQ